MCILARSRSRFATTSREPAAAPAPRFRFKRQERERERSNEPCNEPGRAGGAGSGGFSYYPWPMGMVLPPCLPRARLEAVPGAGRWVGRLEVVGRVRDGRLRRRLFAVVHPLPVPLAPLGPRAEPEAVQRLAQRSRRRSVAGRREGTDRGEDAHAPIVVVAAVVGVTIGSGVFLRLAIESATGGRGRFPPLPLRRFLRRRSSGGNARRRTCLWRPLLWRPFLPSPSFSASSHPPGAATTAAAASTHDSHRPWPRRTRRQRRGGGHRIERAQVVVVPRRDRRTDPLGPRQPPAAPATAAGGVAAALEAAAALPRLARGRNRRPRGHRSGDGQRRRTHRS